LLAGGFDWHQDYSAFRWISDRARIYRVDAEFPRLSAHDMNAGISNVRYSLSLTDCEDYLVTQETFDAALAGASNGD
jgi:hypothetical protein